MSFSLRGYWEMCLGGKLLGTFQINSFIHYNKVLVIHSVIFQINEFIDSLVYLHYKHALNRISMTEMMPTLSSIEQAVLHFHGDVL